VTTPVPVSIDRIHDAQQHPPVPSLGISCGKFWEAPGSSVLAAFSTVVAIVSVFVWLDPGRLE
jgi:hypothetical protein